MLVALAAFCQSLLEAMTVCPEKSLKLGLAKVPDTGMEGPRARMSTSLGSLPVMTNPPIIWLSPVSTRPRVERLVSEGEAEDERVKVAVTARLAFIVIWQEPVPEQPAPLHPPKREPDEGLAVRVTTVPPIKASSQS